MVFSSTSIKTSPVISRFLCIGMYFPMQNLNSHPLHKLSQTLNQCVDTDLLGGILHTYVAIIWSLVTLFLISGWESYGIFRPPALLLRLNHILQASTRPSPPCRSSLVCTSAGRTSPGSHCDSILVSLGALGHKTPPFLPDILAKVHLLQ